jgi:transposase
MKVHQISREPTGSEGARRATEDSVGSVRSQIPDPEVMEKPKRRRFSSEYKLRIVREADSCKGDGDVGALLRREGLYFSTLSNWRRQRDEIVRKGLAGVRRGRKAKKQDPRIKELERENAQLRLRLKKAETILEIQKKASELLGISLESPDSEEND